MWQQHSSQQQVGTSNPGALDFLVGQRALAAGGYSQKEIALMLAVNSAVIRKWNKSKKGKDQESMSIG
jgi:hypothetical protein